MSHSRSYLVRNLDSSSFLETFLISAIVTILGIRLYLYVNNFPQVGGDGLHIAHMLWGGVMMLIAIIVLLAFVDRASRWATALLAGIGFGFFADELGKFLTSDNNYFFRPTVSILYIAFVAMFLTFRALEHRAFPKRDLLVNSIESFKEATIRNLDARDIDRARRLLSQCLHDDPVVVAFDRLLEDFRVGQAPSLTRWQKIKRTAGWGYVTLVAKPWFERIVIGVFVLGAVISMGLAVVSVEIAQGHSVHDPQLVASMRSFDNVAPVIFGAVSALITVVGAAVLLRSRLWGYRLIRVSLLISLFLTQIFEFYDIQFGALFGLGLDLIGLAVINTLINLELHHRKARRPGQETAAVATPA